MHVQHLYLQWKETSMLDIPKPPYGVAAPEAVAALSGKEILQAIMAGELPAPPMAKTLDFSLVEVRDGTAAFEGEPSEAFLNPMGAVHGGWALTLVDRATGCAALSLLPPGAAYRTIETKVNFSRPIMKDAGRVRAEATVVARGRRIISAEARVTDARGRVLAHGTSTLMVLNEGAGA
jgi:uncharacterized protein (TIGR00369 family)